MTSPSRRTKVLVSVCSILLGLALVLAAEWFKRRWMMPDHGKQQVRTDITVIREALDAYAIQHEGRYPDSLQAIIEPDDRGHRYLNVTRVPRDPWNREYIYIRDPINVLTYGRDGKPGGTDDDADLDYLSIVDRR